MPDDTLLIPARSVHTRRLTNDEIVERLGKASETVHADMSPWTRWQTCLLWEARDRMLLLMGRVESARKANEDMRRQRDEAREGVVSADWWNDTNDPETSYCDLNDALSDVGYGEIVGLTGAAWLASIWGFRLPPDDAANSDDERDVWCDTLKEAERKLAEVARLRALAGEGETP